MLHNGPQYLITGKIFFDRGFLFTRLSPISYLMFSLPMKAVSCLFRYRILTVSLRNNPTFVFQPREENPIPRHNRFTMNRPPSKTEFFNIYSSNSNKREQHLQTIQREERQHGMQTVLQASNKEQKSFLGIEEQHDQRVPTNMAARRQRTGKENSRIFRGTSSGNLHLQTQNERGRDSKRNATQILALFSSCKDIPPPKIPFRKENAQTNDVNIVRGIILSERNDGKGDAIPDMDDLENYSQAKRISTFSDVPQTKLDNDSSEGELGWNQDFSDSFDLSPDSFAACSDERKAGAAVSDLFDFNGGVTSCETGSQEPVSSKQHCASVRRTEFWCENDSESISPVVRLLNDGERDVMGDEYCTAVGLKGRSAEYCDLFGEEHQESCEHLQSPNEAAIHNPCSLLHSSQSSSLFSTCPSDPHESGDEKMDTSNCAEGRLNFLKGIHQRHGLLEEKSSLEKRSRNSGLGMNSNQFSNHPGSLFAYAALQTDQDDNLRISSFSNLHKREILRRVERCNQIFEQKVIGDREENFMERLEASPEFYSAEIMKTNDWNLAPEAPTKMILNNSRTVSAFNPLTAKSDWHLISPHNITHESHIKVIGIKQMITNERSSL